MCNIINKEINMKAIPEAYSQDLKDLIKLMLNKDPDKRPVISEILESDLLKDKLIKYKIKYNKSTRMLIPKKLNIKYQCNILNKNNINLNTVENSPRGILEKFKITKYIFFHF